MAAKVSGMPPIAATPDTEANPCDIRNERKKVGRSRRVSQFRISQRCAVSKGASMWRNREPYVHTIRRRGVPLRPEELDPPSSPLDENAPETSGWVRVEHQDEGDGRQTGGRATDTTDTPPNPADHPHTRSPEAHRVDAGNEVDPNQDEDEIIVLAAAGTAAEPAAEPVADDTIGGAAGDASRFCRICYDDEDGGEMGFLFRPCRCAGTCALVHVGCLNTWRAESANRNSAFQCDQCKYEYRFGAAETTKLNVAQLMGAKWFTEIASFVGLFALIVAVGVTFDIFQLPALVDTFDDMPDVGFIPRVLALGTSTVGLCGFVVTWLSAGVWNGVRMFGVVDGGGGGRGGDILKLIAVVVGLAMTYYHIYGWVRDFVRKTVQAGTTIILDIEGEAPGAAAARARENNATRPPAAQEEIPDVD